ncbi:MULTISPECIES: winged helix-turn-helix transcriptional regulator [unclassified Paenibacillus]|uniref:winged helix-turn-helix transcriptional regulator n=1 Tax=unclassified Paenibacillus TaxID=185978 RepID=UPI000839C9D4|nr:MULTISPECIES: helix-turn-helix domain-containing protein [unclassified Paenibacillus]NWL88651.1 transcriptional regulator [Paenibacillus sp. 79R4]
MSLNKKINSNLPENKCSVSYTQQLIAGRWKLVIMWHLSQETRRFNELQKLLPGVSKGILTRQLREMEEDGLVHREVYKEVPPKVEYSLTKEGQEFLPILTSMGNWGAKHREILEQKKNNK